jgi:hypothetical protein
VSAVLRRADLVIGLARYDTEYCTGGNQDYGQRSG